MDVHKIIRQSIYTRLIASSDFATAIKQSNIYKLFYHIAPQNLPNTKVDIALPYVVMDILPINPDWDSAQDFYDCIIQLRISGRTLEETENISGYAIERLKDAVLTFDDDFELLKIVPLPQINLGLTDNVWNMVVQFRLNIQKMKE